jgi:hypothetical protein
LISVFGRVVKGMEVVEQISKVDVDGKDKPFKDVVIVNCGELIKKSAVSAVQGELYIQHLLRVCALDTLS